MSDFRTFMASIHHNFSDMLLRTFGTTPPQFCVFFWKNRITLEGYYFIDFPHYWQKLTFGTVFKNTERTRRYTYATIKAKLATLLSDPNFIAGCVVQLDTCHCSTNPLAACRAWRTSEGKMQTCACGVRVWMHACQNDEFHADFKISS